MDEEMREVIEEFLVESYENLDRMDQEFVALERDPDDRDVLASVFRTIHTIKGTSGFLGFTKLEALTHVGENLLSRLRDGELRLSAESTTALLAMVDAVRAMLASIEADGHDGEFEYEAIIDLLSELNDAEATTPAAAPEPEPEPEPPLLGEVLVAAGTASEEAVAEAVVEQDEGDPRRVGEILVEKGAVEPGQVLEALHAQAEKSGSSIADNSIRVDVALLDKLMNLVGELVLARNQVLQHATTFNDAAFLANSQRLNLITTELQEGVMKTRMQPIGNVWNKLPRVVRDLAQSCGKQVRLEMEGRDTELDKTVLEAIKDPLTHLVRNSVDHGIETAADRVAAGKPAEGTLLLRAFHESGLVNIEITDDGAGIDVEKVRAKAVERGVVPTDQAARMGDREVMNLIFQPGFSTAEKVTNVSGRGVGMDVVKTNIEKIGGTVDVQSRVGEGTTLRIKIPLTLAIIPALVVCNGDARYAIPQVSLLELVRLEAEQARTSIERIQGSPVYRLRGKLLPLVYLREALDDRTNERDENAAVNIVVLQADEQQFGLVVEGVEDTAEIVVKPLGKQLKAIPIFAGATIMGDGRVALILDVMGIAQRAKVLTELHDKSRAVAEAEAARRKDGQTMLLVDAAHGRRVAVPLGAVARLEQFELSKLEWAGSQRVVQYTGELLPIVSVGGLLGYGEPDQGELLEVVVVWQGDRQVGLHVAGILDIVEDVELGRSTSTNPGIVGSVVIDDRVTDVLDMRSVVAAVDPALLTDSRFEEYEARV